MLIPLGPYGSTRTAGNKGIAWSALTQLVRINLISVVGPFKRGRKKERKPERKKERKRGSTGFDIFFLNSVTPLFFDIAFPSMLVRYISLKNI